MSFIKIVPLGAGQDVGRSCVLVSLGGKNIMFDCGVHMGFQDLRKFPDFTYICKNIKGDGQAEIERYIDCIAITHFHLDHSGGLPYLTEIVGYNGPIFMTYPTKAITPVLLNDLVKVVGDKQMSETASFNVTTTYPEMYSVDDVKKCMKKVTAIQIHQTVHVEKDFSITAYYAGHVLGAAMFLLRVGELSVLYTGDYNMTPDRHLGAAWVDKIYPDVLITESTYATTIRDSKRARESDFLKKVHDCVSNGGKVLIPSFALGRAQELCILLETYWERMSLKIPVYFSAGLTSKANDYYKLFINWTNQKLKQTFVKRLGFI
jgi:integrator complex subunit 11